MTLQDLRHVIPRERYDLWRAHHGHDENGNNPISLEQLLYNIAVDMDTSVQQLKLTYLYGTLNPDFHPQDRDVLPIAKGRDDPGTAKPIVRKARYPMTPGSNHVDDHFQVNGL